MSSPVRSITLSLASDKLHIPTPFYFSNLTSHHLSSRASVWPGYCLPVLPLRCAHACLFITQWDQLPILCRPGSTTNPTELKAFLKNLTTIHTASISFVISSKYVPNQNALRLSLHPSFPDQPTSYVLRQFMFLWAKEDIIAQIKSLGFGVGPELELQPIHRPSVWPCKLLTSSLSFSFPICEMAIWNLPQCYYKGKNC